MLKPLLKDPVVRIALVVVAFGAAPMVAPFLSAYPLWTLALLTTQIPLIAVAILAFEHRLGRTQTESEQRFWHLWAAGFGFWMAQSLFGLFNLGGAESRVGVELTRTGLTFAFYLCLALAIENRPHVGPGRRSGRLQSMERVGAVVFIVGQLTYFAVAPGVLDVSAYWSSSLVLSVVLDAYLVYRLFSHWKAAGDPTWRRVYRWLAVTSALWLVSDAIKMAVWAGIGTPVAATKAIGLLWIPALLTVIVAARLRHVPTSTGRDEAALKASPPLVGPLLVYAVAFPLVHFLFYRLEIAEASLKPIREVVALVFLVVLAGMGAGYQELLRRQNRRLEDERREAQAKVQHQAYHDALTGLPNRLLFNDHLSLALAQARRHGLKVAVLFLDLDEFKLINDSRGHVVGDELLEAVARRLRGTVRQGDTVARLGGDEFIILLESLRAEMDAARVARNLLGLFRDPFMIQSREHHISASIGVAIFPNDGGDEVALVKNADIAMYQAKREGRGTYRLFAAAMNDEAVERLALEEDLRKALERNELFLDYQPIVELATGRMLGAEALLRWQHPERGLLRPDSFIDLAESTGLIVPIGRWALRETCRQLVEWRAAGRELVVAANLSARQLREPGFAVELARAVDETGIEPAHLDVEITESMAIEHERDVIDQLGLARELGVKVSLDDFGTRHSSLSRLRNLPIDTLKIDRSFVMEIEDDPQCAAIVQAIVDMSEAMSLDVIVEGVERESQRQMLYQSGCRIAQGYFFARPMSPEALAKRYDETVGTAPVDSPDE